MKTILATALLAATLVPSSALAASRGQLELTTDGEFQRTEVTYNCGAEGPLKVTYVNADPNFLAVVSLSSEPQPLVFATVLSGSGARYAAGKWIWWTKGSSADLYDTTQGDNAPPVTSCTEIPSS